jgi:hypothetical protein
MRLRIALVLFFVCTIPVFACSIPSPCHSQESSAEKPAEVKPFLFEGTKVAVTPPASWKSVPPKNQMVEGEFRFPAEGKESIRITFSRSGGSIDANVKRWIGQFEGAKPDQTKVDKKTVDKLTVHTVDVAGTYLDSMGGGPFAPGPTKKQENYRMIGAIVEMPKGQNLFIKAYGPKDLVEKTKADFDKMIEGITNK